MHETRRPNTPIDCRTIPTRSCCTLNLWIIVCKTFDISIIRSTEKKNGRYYRRGEILDYSAIVGSNLSRHRCFNTKYHISFLWIGHLCRIKYCEFRNKIFMLVRRRSNRDLMIKLGFNWRTLWLPWIIVRMYVYMYINNELEPLFVTFYYSHCDCDINLDQVVVAYASYWNIFSDHPRNKNGSPSLYYNT